MCYNPVISFSTFLIEFLLGIFLLYLSKSRLNEIGAIILFSLGFYQLGEFFICKDILMDLWARIGYSFATLLPALGLHLTFILTRKKFNFYYYLVPGFFIFFILFTNQVISGSVCHKFFVEFLYGSNLFYYLHSVYYALFLFVAVFLIIKNKIKNKILYLLSLLSFILPTLILLILFPELLRTTGSVLCHFALLFAILLFYIIYKKS